MKLVERLCNVGFERISKLELDTNSEILPLTVQYMEFTFGVEI